MGIVRHGYTGTTSGGIKVKAISVLWCCIIVCLCYYLSDFIFRKIKAIIERGKPIHHAMAIICIEKGR